MFSIFDRALSVIEDGFKINGHTDNNLRLIDDTVIVKKRYNDL